MQKIFPNNGSAGARIRISGEGFGSIDHSAEVSVNGKAALMVSASDMLLIAEVPVEAGSGPVGGKVDGKEAQGQSFTYQAIWTVKPLTGGKGTRVVISGEGFETAAAANTVEFNGKKAVVTSASEGELVMVAPDGVQTGPLTVTINQQCTTGPAFTVVPPPAIGVVSPLIGPAGTQMTISGDQFSAIADENKVYINNKEVTINSVTAREIKLTIPAGVGSGKVVVMVNDQRTEGPDFKDQTLTILAVSPDNGLAGTQVTITGTGFDSNSALNTVTFNGTPAQVLSATKTTLTVITPPTLTTGQLMVRSLHWPPGKDIWANWPSAVAVRCMWPAKATHG